MGGFELPVRAMRTQIAAAVNLIVQVNRLSGGPRKVTAITEILMTGERGGQQAKVLVAAMGVGYLFDKTHDMRRYQDGLTSILFVLN